MTHLFETRFSTNRFIHTALIGAVSLLSGLSAQNTADSIPLSLTPEIANVNAPVVFKGDTLFYIGQRVGAYTPQDRADKVSERLKSIAKEPRAQYDSLKVTVYEDDVDVVLRDLILTAATPFDTIGTGLTTMQIAQSRKEIIQEAMIKNFEDVSVMNLGKDIAFFLLSILGLYLILRLLSSVYHSVYARVDRMKSNIIFKDNQVFKFFKIITPDNEKAALLLVVKGLRILFTGLVLYLYLPFMFSQISYTRGFGEKLLGLVLKPLKFLGSGLLNFLPNLLFIVVVIFAMRYILQGFRYVARQIRFGRMTLPGFYPDWAYPTFNLVRVLMIIFTLVIIFPYLPGSDSSAFKGITVFVGLLVSLGGAGAISNVISGIILTYMRPFTIGDRVEINGTTGDILAKNLLVTRIKTLKGEEITIPNAALLNGGIKNFSSLAKEDGIIVHTTITIGYDVPWPQVHELMIAAALKTENILEEPAPFVLQKSLEDWYVAYEINAHTKATKQLPRIYSNLHANLQDVFNEANVEIMSSHYQAIRDGNMTTIPTQYLPPSYKPPGFGVSYPKGDGTST